MHNPVGYRITPPVATLNIHPIANAMSEWDANGYGTRAGVRGLLQKRWFTKVNHEKERKTNEEADIPWCQEACCGLCCSKECLIRTGLSVIEDGRQEEVVAIFGLPLP